MCEALRSAVRMRRQARNPAAAKVARVLLPRATPASESRSLPSRSPADRSQFRPPLQLFRLRPLAVLLANSCFALDHPGGAEVVGNLTHAELGGSVSGYRSNASATAITPSPFSPTRSDLLCEIAAVNGNVGVAMRCDVVVVRHATRVRRLRWARTHRQTRRNLVLALRRDLKKQKGSARGP